MGILGGDWVADRDPNITEDVFAYTYAPAIAGQSEFELHTDVDITFTMTGQTDAGLTFGASIDLDESDGDGDEGASEAFDNRNQGGEEIFVSGAFGTLTMGDTDGALDWALQDTGIGSSLGDAHTSHLGYIGNDYADSEGGDGQIARYDHSFGDFAVALSADIAEAGGKDVFAAGAKYNASFPAVQIGLGVGYQHRAHDGTENEVIGVSLDADFNNGFRAILNWVDMGDTVDTNYSLDNGSDFEEVFMGIGLAYIMDDWMFAVNWSQITEGAPRNAGQEGYGVAVNYDLGGGADVQLGYSMSKCKKFIDVPNADLAGGPVYEDAALKCRANEAEETNYSTFSLGVAMSF